MTKLDSPILPPDYNELTAAGQKEARVAGIRDITSPHKLVAAWDFFRRHYLLPAAETGTPFYQTKGTGEVNFCESPDFHYQMLYDIGQYSRNVYAAPRGAGKSKVIGAEVPLLLALARPGFDISLSLATTRQVTERMGDLMLQLEENKRIIDDFGIQKPKRGGSRSWGKQYLNFLNGSKIRGYSVEGKKRGDRPSLFILDDPEFDPSGSTDMSKLRDQFGTLLFRQIIPMLEEGCGIFWIGTKINRQAYLWYACSTGKDEDPRFRYWNRVSLGVDSYEQATGKKLWAEKWSDDWERRKKEEIGPAAFAAEYDNNPMSDSDRLFAIDPILDGYEVIDGPDTTIESTPRPLSSNSQLKYLDVPALGENKEPKETIVTAGDFFQQMTRFIVIDRGFSLKKSADYSVIHVMGVIRHYLFSLDLWVGRCKTPEFIDLICKYGQAWRVRIVGVEAVGVQQELYERTAERVATVGPRDSWTPSVIPIKYRTHESKENRISGLEVKFNRHTAKIPIARRDKWPYKELFYELENFTPDGAMLEHDDAIDTFANYTKIVKGPAHPKMRKEEPDPDSYKARRELSRTTGLPISPGVKDPKLVAEALKERRKRLAKQRKNRYNRRGERHGAFKNVEVLS